MSDPSMYVRCHVALTGPDGKRVLEKTKFICEIHISHYGVSKDIPKEAIILNPCRKLPPLLNRASYLHIHKIARASDEQFATVYVSKTTKPQRRSYS